MADRLSALLQRFELTANVFHQGTLTGSCGVETGQGAGHLHLLRQGRLEATDDQGWQAVLDEPSVLFLPRDGAHRLIANDAQGAELVCATVEFGVGDENPLLRALPARLVIPLTKLPGIGLTQQLLFGEAFGQRCGRDGVVNRLAEVLVIQMLRHAIEQRLVDGGLIAGLADPQLHKALCAMHASPARGWSLESMAAEAGMSRARFAAHFAHLVGVPPGAYLTSWRLGLARTMLRRGLPVKQVAAQVGYASASALCRVFAQRLGQSPAAWQRRGHSGPPRSASLQVRPEFNMNDVHRGVLDETPR